MLGVEGTQYNATEMLVELSDLMLLEILFYFG